MNRRETAAAMFALGVSPLAALAQTAGKVYRIGILSNEVPREYFAGFFGGLHDLGLLAPTEN